VTGGVAPVCLDEGTLNFPHSLQAFASHFDFQLLRLACKRSRVQIPESPLFCCLQRRRRVRRVTRRSAASTSVSACFFYTALACVYSIVATRSASLFGFTSRSFAAFGDRTTRQVEIGQLTIEPCRQAHLINASELDAAV
jgi:hypothetical protein